jgi:hypothetical protein
LGGEPFQKWNNLYHVRGILRHKINPHQDKDHLHKVNPSSTSKQGKNEKHYETPSVLIPQVFYHGNPSFSLTRVTPYIRLFKAAGGETASSPSARERCHGNPKKCSG